MISLTISFLLQGLVVPVLRNVQDMDYADIEKVGNLSVLKVKINISV